MAAAAFQTQASNYHELSMHHTLLFADSLKDLKNLRTQLYSAADYFELSFTNDDQKHMVVEILKDYAMKALVNTVDHLGSVTFKVNDIVEDKIGQAQGADLRLSCIEQRLHNVEMYMNHEGRSQQSSAISDPKYHKRYNLPAGETLNCSTRTKSKYYRSSMDDDDGRRHFRIEPARPTSDDALTLTTAVNNKYSHSTLTQTSLQPEVFFYDHSIQKADLDNRRVLPHQFAHLHSGSFASRPTTPNGSRAFTPRTSIDKRQNPSEQQKSASMRFYTDEYNSPKDSQQQKSKSKRLLQALLSRRRSKKDDMLYTFLDEY
uniref:Uncharacterized protein n=1 Tax=Kalanchoe fedtschenkoi TaxID=63787 RepID=A0A7N0RB96_KALFE